MTIPQIIGITEKEYTLFKCLNDFGDQSATELVKRTNIPSSKIYFHLESLTKKGLVTINDGKKHRIFHAQHPNALKELYLKKLEELKAHETLIDAEIKLHDRNRLTKEQYLTIETYHGIKGIMSFYDKILRIGKQGEIIRMAGSVKLTSPTLRGYFRQFHDKRAEKGIILYAVKEKDLPEVIEKFAHSKIHYIDKKAPAVYVVFRDYVGIILSNIQPTALVIRNKDLAISFQSYFDEIFEN